MLEHFRLPHVDVKFLAHGDLLLDEERLEQCYSTLTL
jgi:hypothetical protein